MIHFPTYARLKVRFLVPVLIATIALGSVVGAQMAAAANTAGSAELAAYEGDWSLVDPVANHDSRMAAIDEAIGGLSWVMRKMAGPVLRKSIAPPPRMQFLWDGERLEQRILEARGDRARTVEFGVEQHEGTDIEGEPLLASWTRTESGLELRWQQHQANGRNLYRIDAETGSLIIEHTINITAISDVEPIVFESKFGRLTPPVVATQPLVEAHLTP